ncbi:C40 family peptidase [Peptostreptococcus sp. D1]|uniref:C40 family peptidase n=1 Tax=Peptostreptococcus sp. D1 TaxID=72304 RepID=UPI0008E3B4F6|nr:NlpC/P60 family protein [Peptostreptococcus sp. D1]SFE87716.1 NlpC/P60 family protein [Peptostreptococcus sp. D1]
MEAGDTLIKLILHIRQGAFWDITDMVPYVRISGDSANISRTLETEIFQNIYDKQLQSIGILEGSSICFYENEKELYRGNIIDVSKSAKSHTVKITVKDIGYNLGSVKISKNYNNITAEKIAEDVIKQSKLGIGKIAKTNIKLTRFFRDVSAYEMIMTMYTLASKTTKKQYMVEVELDKINVIERGQVIDISFDENNNIYDLDHNISIDNLINTVTVTDNKGNKISQNTNSELSKIFYFIKNKIIEVEDKNKATKEVINAEYHGSDYTTNLTGYGNYNCRSGMKVHVKEPQTGLIGEFFIDSDTHEWSGGAYKCTLGLNFNNIMDSKEAGSDKEESSETGEGDESLGISFSGGATSNEKQRIILAEAYKMVGKGRYTYGGRSNIYNTDCSGFIYFIHKKAGITVGSATSSQKSNGKAVSLKNILPGDFIVMGSKYSPSGRHVVLYVGDGMIIHNGGPAGAPITKRKLYTYGKYYVRRCWG